MEEEDEVEITDEEFNRFLEIIANLVERTSSPEEAAGLLRKLKVGEKGKIDAVLNAVSVLAESCKTLEEFKNAFAEVFADR